VETNVETNEQSLQVAGGTLGYELLLAIRERRSGRESASVAQ
jgi:hypothetical protein